MSTHYDEIAADYQKSKFAPWRVHIEQHTLFMLAGDLHGLSVLDLACGEGIYSRTAKRHGAARVVGVDLSKGMIDLAREEEKRTSLGIDYHVHDAATIDLHERFDIVIASYLFNYAPTRESLESMARSVARHLKPGGRLVAVNNHPGQSPLAFEATRKYGLIKSAPRPLVDGSRVTFTIFQDTGEFTIENYHLSVETHEQAFKSAGLQRMRWHRPDVAPEGRNKFPADHWYDFLADPPVIFIEAYGA
jgi:SAM-dependent methyltransferase